MPENADTDKEKPRRRRYCPKCGMSWITTATTAVCDGTIVLLTDARNGSGAFPD